MSLITHKFLTLLLLTAAALLLFSCEETVELDLEQVDTLYVVDGLITDQNKRHYVRLKQSADFYAQSETPVVTDAKVFVTVEGQTIEFLHQADEPGTYRPVEAFAGQYYQRYDLRVEVGGQVIEASDSLLPIPNIDALEQRIDPDALDDPPYEDEPDRVYELLLYTSIPNDADTTRYYLFKSYRNGEIYNDDGTSVFVTDDVFVGSEISGFPLPDYYAVGDTGKIEIYSISRSAFVFLNDLNTALNTDGGIFGPIPANPRNNLSGGALGFFQTAGMVTDSLVIQQE